jgi:hypothetical protein
MRQFSALLISRILHVGMILAEDGGYRLGENGEKVVIEMIALPNNHTNLN